MRQSRRRNTKLASQVALEPGVRINEIGSADLHRLLQDMEATGLQTAHSVGDYRDPFVERVAALSVESVYGFTARPGRVGAVRVDRARTVAGAGRVLTSLPGLLAF
jgi:hypothetical protein